MNETREQLKEEIRAHAPACLKRDKSGKGYICPICGSGSGDKGTGITSKDGIHFTCWAGCYTNADIIDIIGQLRGLTDYNDRLQAAAEEILHYSGNVHDLPRDNGSTTIRPNTARQPAERTPTAQEPDFTEFFKECAARINETDYHRGISAETLHRFNVGYCPDWINPQVIAKREANGDPWRPPATPRLIVPTSQHSYLARDTRQDIPDNQKAYSKTKVGNVHMMNLEALNGQEPVYIEEGEINALSIIDVGAAAIALGSTAMVNQFLVHVKKYRPNATLILSLDNDQSGERAQTKLKKGLESLRIPFICYNVSGRYNDPNDFLMADRAAFTATVQEGIELAKETPEDKYRRENAASEHVQSIINEIAAGIGITNYIPTGFQQLDNLLDGGLFPGLYIVGALSSLGKTTFMLQIADQIAASGKDVLFFSLEMAENELIIKSVSRITYLLSVDKGKGKTLAKTTRGIMTGTRWGHYRAEEKQHIAAAFEAYRQTMQRHMLIIPGEGEYTAEKISAAVKKHVSLTGEKPVVFVDYLQIISPADPRSTDKQNTDQAVLTLKRLSRDYNIPVFCVSSFNRENYYSPVSMTSFKESGAIEYSSDVLIGMQPKGWDLSGGEKLPERSARLGRITHDNEKAAKNGEAIALEVKVLKNRNGSKGTVNMAFTPCFNHYAEIEQEPDENAVDIETQEGERVIISSTKGKAKGNSKIRGIE